MKLAVYRLRVTNDCPPLTARDCFPRGPEVQTRVAEALHVCSRHERFPLFCAVGGRRFRYLFYVDFVGNLADDLPQNALRHLQEVTDFMRVLGCYPMHVEAAQP